MIIEWLRLDIFVTLAAIIVAITQIVKAAPVAVTSNFPKIMAWIVTALVVGGIGLWEGDAPETIITIGTALAFAANGLYDVVSGPIIKIIAFIKK